MDNFKEKTLNELAAEKGAIVEKIQQLKTRIAEASKTLGITAPSVSKVDQLLEESSKELKVYEERLDKALAALEELDLEVAKTDISMESGPAPVFSESLEKDEDFNG